MGATFDLGWVSVGHPRPWRCPPPLERHTPALEGIPCVGGCTSRAQGASPSFSPPPPLRGGGRNRVDEWWLPPNLGVSLSAGGKYPRTRGPPSPGGGCPPPSHDIGADPLVWGGGVPGLVYHFGWVGLSDVGPPVDPPPPPGPWTDPCPGLWRSPTELHALAQLVMGHFDHSYGQVHPVRRLPSDPSLIITQPIPHGTPSQWCLWSWPCPPECCDLGPISNPIFPPALLCYFG